MAKVYTAREMRKEAEFLEWFHGKPYTIATMLRQAADLMEREEKRVTLFRWVLNYVYTMMSMLKDSTVFAARSASGRK